MGWRTTIFLLFAPCPASVIPAKSHPYCPSFCAAVPWTARVDSGVVGAAERIIPALTVRWRNAKSLLDETNAGIDQRSIQQGQGELYKIGCYDHLHHRDRLILTGHKEWHFPIESKKDAVHDDCVQQLGYGSGSVVPKP